jgi:hypothetical protein
MMKEGFMMVKERRVDGKDPNLGSSFNDFRRGKEQGKGSFKYPEAPKYKEAVPHVEVPEPVKEEVKTDQEPLKDGVQIIGRAVIPNRLFSGNGLNKEFLENVSDGFVLTNVDSVKLKRHVTIHNDLKNLFPALNKEERGSLKSSIKERGVENAIEVWVFGSKIILVKGHNRLELCGELAEEGIERPVSVRFKRYKLKNEVITEMVKEQYGRRNMSYKEKIQTALKVYHSLSEEARKNLVISGQQRRKNFLTSEKPLIEKQIHSTKEAAEIAEISTDTMNKVIQVERKDPAKLLDVFTGAKTINRAYLEVFPERNKRIKLDYKSIAANDDTFKVSSEVQADYIVNKSELVDKGQSQEQLSFVELDSTENQNFNLREMTKQTIQLIETMETEGSLTPEVIKEIRLILERTRKKS